MPDTNRTPSKVQAFQAGRRFDDWVADVRQTRDPDVITAFELIELFDDIGVSKAKLMQTARTPIRRSRDGIPGADPVEAVMHAALRPAGLDEWFSVGRKFADVQKIETDDYSVMDGWVPRFRRSLENAGVSPTDRDQIEQAMRAAVKVSPDYEPDRFERPAELLRLCQVTGF